MSWGPAEHANNLSRWLDLGAVRVVARRDDVQGLPDWLLEEYRKVGADVIALDVAWNFPRPIGNLTIDADGVRGEFSFKNVAHRVSVPWSAIVAYTMPAVPSETDTLVLHCMLPVRLPELPEPVSARPVLKLV